jgi:ketol-acid reductoisomerase
MNRIRKEMVCMSESTVALFGAAGKIGTRITDILRHDVDYRMLYVEAGEAGMDRLRAMGLTPSLQAEAVQEADILVLAIPDMLIGRVSRQVVPKLNAGALVVLLDPAAPHGGQLPERTDVAYFVVHPCHPPLINDEVDPAARDDFWGGKAKQNIVCALMQGSDDDYAKGESLARRMFAPVMNAHRITVEQMAILEPTMAETMILTCQVVIKEAIEEAIHQGVPRQVAYDFAMGHMRVNLGILFGFIDAEVSDGAKLAVERAKESVFQQDWKRVFEPENVLAEVEAIVRGRGQQR